MIFSIFRFFFIQIPDFQIVASQPNIVLTNHTSMEILCIQRADDVYLSLQVFNTYDWFSGPGSLIGYGCCLMQTKPSLPVVAPLSRIPCTC